MTEFEAAFCGCGSPLDGRTYKAYCSCACRQAAYRQRHRQANLNRGLWTALLGMYRAMGKTEDEFTAASRNAKSIASRNAEATDSRNA